MTDLAVVAESSPEPEDTQLALFEGKVVQRYRLAPGSIPEFACLDNQNEHVMLHEGDIVVIQVEALVTSVEIGASYKGGIQTKARDRVHHAKVQDGTQQIVHVLRSNP